MTRETEKAFIIIYSEYLRRRSFGTAKSQATYFENAKLKNIDAFSLWNSDDIRSSIDELVQIGFVKMDIVGGVQLMNPGIEYMEQKPKEYFSAFAGVVKGIAELISMFL